MLTLLQQQKLKTIRNILFIAIVLWSPTVKSQSQKTAETHRVIYFGDTIQLTPSSIIITKAEIDNAEIQRFYSEMNKTDFTPITSILLKYKSKNQLDDWLFYQLVRRTAQQFSSKYLNYNNYTLYKWFLLVKCGYDAKLAFVNNKLLFYVQSNDNIYDIPLFTLNDKQYVCLNSHDFEKIDFALNELKEVKINVKNATKNFSYKINKIPDFKESISSKKELLFLYNENENKYSISVNDQMSKVFNNYPSVDFESYFNIPLSNQTYSSLIPQLKKQLAKMKQLDAIDYLMQFTRNAFLYENDQKNFGSEKRLSPELTLMNKYSDCDDRAALFYYLVKEMYNLPMIILVFPTHIAVAVNLDNPVGFAINYNGKKYSVCEPTPQKINLQVGELMPELHKSNYEIAFAYNPSTK